MDGTRNPSIVSPLSITDGREARLDDNTAIEAPPARPIHLTASVVQAVRSHTEHLVGT